MTSISNRRDRPQTSRTGGWLPVELVSQIVEIFVNRLSVDHEWQPEWPDSITTEPFLPPRAISELLGLRLVCKIWALAVTPICFRAVWSYNSVIGLITSPVLALDVSSFVKRLAFKDWSSKPEPKEEPWPTPVDRSPPRSPGSQTNTHQDPAMMRLRPVSSTSTRTDPDLMTSPTVTTDQVVELITLIGQDATELHLKVSGSIIITPALVKAVKSIKGLKTLGIQGTRQPQTRDGYDPQAFSDLLAAAPNLECLILNGCNLENLTLPPTALSKLKHLALIHCLWARNVKAIASICALAKNSMKSFEVLVGKPSLDLFSEPLEMTTMLQSCLNAIEILSCSSIMEDLPRELRYSEYPQLRVLHDIDSSDIPCDEEDEPAGNLPIFRHVRTYVQPIDDGQHFWRWNLERCTLDRTPSQYWTRHWKPPRLRLLIFTSPRKKNYTILSAKLVATLESHGIHCCYIPTIKPDKILKLDLEFNGPVE